MDVAKKYQDRLDDIKKNVKDTYEYFKPNYDRYNEFIRFVFESTLKNEEINLLAMLGKPQLEFNVCEPYISRLLGEFSKQEPDVEVSADDQNSADPLTIRILEDHLRHVFSDRNNHHVRYSVYRDLLAGGFSVFKIVTDYSHPMSFDQVINVERAFDPTLCGFDKLSKYSHKGDGRFCFENFPMNIDDFVDENPEVKIDKVKFIREPEGSKQFSGFNWSYMNGNEKIIMVCDYYEKKKKKTKIVKLSSGQVIPVSKYEEIEKNWNNVIPIPVPVGKTRMTDIETICRYRCIENKVIEYVETDFNKFPLIFVDGNSITVRTNKNGNIRQMTRPYVYNAKGAQRLKNYAGISLANEIENIVQHKFIIKTEALPMQEEFLQAIKDIQKPNNVVVNAFFNQDPDKPIPEPIREISKVPAPPEVLQAFTGTDSVIQNSLGSYDASIGINDNQLSGLAIVEAATQSNAAAMPYVVGFMQGLQRVAEVYVDLFPKYIVTPRTLPIVDRDGHRNYIMINQKGGHNMFYDSNALNVLVKAGASFSVQKSRMLMVVKEMMGMSPMFAQFIAEKGLNFVLDNMEGRGIDQLKSMVGEWQQEMQKQKQQAMQMQQQQMQNNPQVMKNQIEMQKLQQEEVESQRQFAIDMGRLKQDENRLMVEMEQARNEDKVELVKANAEQFSKAVDLKMQHKDMAHRHLKEALELHHKVNQQKNEIR